MHKQPLQRIVSMKCSGWSGEEYLRNGAPDYLVCDKDMFGQAICSSCKNISTPKSSEIPDKQNLTWPVEEKAIIEDDNDVKVVIPMRKSNRRRTKSFKVKEQDEMTAKETKIEMTEETDPSSILPCDQDEMDLNESDVNSAIAQSQTEVREFCEDCGKMVTKLLRHKRMVHLKEKNHVCGECGFAFFDKQGLRQHIRLVHEEREGKESPISCGECGARFNGKLNFNKHQRHAHNGQSSRESRFCEECGIKVANIWALRDHKKRVHLQEKNHVCNECGAAFFSITELRSHEESVHEERDFNGENKAFKEYAAQHIKIVDGGKKMCLLCDKTLSQNSNLKRHFSDRHCNNFLSFICPCCDHLFKTENSLRKHVCTYHPETNFTSAELRTFRESIEETEDQFELKSDDDESTETLQETKMEMEEKTDPSLFPSSNQDEQMDFGESDENSPPTQSQIQGSGFCEDCGKTVAKLSRHKRMVHRKDKNVFCNECGAAFFDKSVLWIHIKRKHKETEGKESLIPCGECGARFNSQLNVKKHMRHAHAHKVKQVEIRVAEPMHPCTAPLAITKKEGSDELVIHSVVGAHLENEYKGSTPPLKDTDFYKVVFPDGVCTFCESTFKQMYYLSLHLKFKHAFDWYQCPSCNIWRNRPCDIVTHCAEVHTDTDLEVLCPCCKVHINVREIEGHSLKCFLINYRRHTRHHTFTSFKCRLCSKTMPSRSRYDKHLRSSHYDEIFKCSHKGCNYISIPDWKQINKHLMIHEKSTTENTNSSDPIICDICGRTFPIRGVLLNHLKIEHGALSEVMSKFPCPECDDVFGSQVLVGAHVNTVHLKLSYDCDKCDKTFSDLWGFKQHERKVHEKEKQRVQCDICAEWSVNKECLDNHVRSKHSGEKPFMCTFCDETFYSLALMTSHRKRCHPDSWREEKKRRRWLVENKDDPSGYKMQCHLCDQTRGTIDELRAHWNADHPGKTDNVPRRPKRGSWLRGDPGTCEFCGEEFLSKYGVQIHIKRRHTEKSESAKCHVCGESCINVSSLIKHKQLVHQIDPIPCFRKTCVCEVCGKNGMTQAALKLHMKTHSANRPKICTYCDKEFAAYVNMTKHRKIAHAEQWKMDKERLMAEEGSIHSSSDRLMIYKKRWYEKNKERMRELERERARAKRAGEKYVCPVRPGKAEAVMN